MVALDRRLDADLVFSNKHCLTFNSFGVKVRLASNTAAGLKKILQAADQALGGKYKLLETKNAPHSFTYIQNKDCFDDLYKNGELIAHAQIRESVLRQFQSELRITVAEYSAQKVFVHSGAVSWRGNGIILPAESDRGKSTLVTELVKLGAKYFSDEYAVLDKDGRVHPFPKSISLTMPGKTGKSEHDVREFGSLSASRSVPVSLVVLTEYKRGAKWRPHILSSAQSVMEILRNSASTRRFPEFTLSVLNRVASSALVVKTHRGEASAAAKAIIELIENRAQAV